MDWDAWLDDDYAFRYPDIAALGADIWHVSVRDGVLGRIVWSWTANGRRHWREARPAEPR